MLVNCLIFFLLGGAIGFLTSTIINQSRYSHGILRIDNTKPDKKLYSFEINNLDILDRKDKIILKITRK